MTDIEKFTDTEKEKSVYRHILYLVAFNFRLIFKNIKNRKRSTAIVTLGLVFALSILFTSSIWTQTSQKIIADDYIETLDYEMYITSWKKNVMSSIYDFVVEDPITRQVDWIYPTIALFNYEDKIDNDTYRWYPEWDQDDMENPLSLSFSFVVNTQAMDRIKLNLDIEGNDSLKSGEIMVSYTQAKQLEEIYKVTISPGYKLNVAITRRIPNTDEGQHYMMNFDIKETTYENYTIAGIYKYVGYNTVIDNLIGGSAAGGRGGMVTDSIFFPMEDMDENDTTIMDTNGILPRLLVKTDAQELRTGGIEKMPDNLLALRERIIGTFYHAFCYIADREIQTMANEYKRAFGSAALFVPTIASAVLLTVLSTQITVKRRREEIALLRSRGASSIQIIGLFFGEFFLISIFSFTISIAFSIFLSALIPSFGYNGFFSSTLFRRYFRYLEISPYEVEIYTVLVLGIYLGMTLINVITYVRKDIQESLLMTRKGQQILSTGVKLAAFALTVAGFIFLFLDYKEIAAENYSFNLVMISASIRTLFVYIVVIFFVCYFVSIAANFLLRNSERVFNYIFRKGKFFISKNIKRYNKNFTDLTFFLILITCLITSFTVIRSSTNHNISLENEYRQGSDIRVQTTISVNITEYEELISNISGINEVTGFYSTKAMIGSQNVEIFGIDPSSYLDVGWWTDYSFVNMSVEDSFASLSSTENGVILSDFTAERLGFRVGQFLYITDFTNGNPPYMQTEVSAIARSAPGLGSAHGYDPKMDRDTSEWALVSKEFFIEEVGTQNGTLLLASIQPNADIDQIIEQIESLSSSIEVNPDRLNPAYIGYFIVEYIPHVTTILLIGAVFLNIIGVIYIVVSTDFILEQRRRENAVLLALGGKQRKIQKLLVSEIIVFISTTIILGVPLGFLTALFSFSFSKPLLMAQEIIPLSIHVGILSLFVMLLLLLVAALLAIIPIMRKQMKYEIVHELRAIV